MDDLLKGFEAGMRLGAPLVEAKLRKKQFEREAGERAKERTLRRSENQANRALQRQLAREAQGNRTLLAMMESGQRERMHSESLAVQREGQAASAAQRERMHKESISLQRDGQTATANHRAAELALREKQFQNGSATSQFKEDRAALQEAFQEAWDMEEALQTNVLSPDYRRELQAKLKAHNSLIEARASQLNMAVANGDHDGVDRVASAFARIPAQARYQYVETGIDSGTGEKTYGIFDPSTGQMKPVAGVPGAGGGGGRDDDDDDPSMLNKDGTLNIDEDFLKGITDAMFGGDQATAPPPGVPSPMQIGSSPVPRKAGFGARFREWNNDPNRQPLGGDPASIAEAAAAGAAKGATGASATSPTGPGPLFGKELNIK